MLTGEIKLQDVMTANIMNNGMSFHSPDSTLSKLLTSTSHHSGYRSHGSTQIPSSVLYRGKTYQSASEALEAYIDNFEKKLSSPTECASKLHLGSGPKLFSTSPHNRREAFRQQRSFKDLDFPIRPLGRRIGSDPDLMSLTTDDLLHLPPDGSLPLTRTSVLQCLTKTKQHLGTQLKHNSSYPSVKPSPEYSENWRRRKDDNFVLLSRKAGDRPLNPTASLEPSRLLHSTRGPSKGDKYKAPIIQGVPSVEDSRLGDQKFNSLSRQNYPRWLTSQKSELGVSGISSIPELKYPGWLQDCDLGSDLNGSDALNGRMYPLGTQYETELVDSKLRSSADKGMPEHEHFACFSHNEDQAFHNHTDPGTCASLQRIPWHIMHHTFTHYHTEEVEDSCCSKPFREDHIDLLIQKAEHVLEALSQHVTNLQQNCGSPGTEEILDADRSWDNPPVTFKPPVPVGNSGEDCFEASNPAQANDTLHDYLNTCHQKSHCGSSEVSGRKHHGPVEALKQMLFSLQTVQQSFENEHTEQQEEVPENFMSQTQDLDFEEAPGSKSLQRALSHLKHLKELVDDIGAKKKKEMQNDRYN
ncbi:lung adenoma susceptibility protein 2 [Pristis pectinata]|uniref:lung adenoma susceptibility protein 2 n=1 Tax=Pristis pectinata TaxID=685728 RepID=UPI00223DA330|nr:lung adenoma susceptibility protein 2 [Pristis pectinata]